MDSSIMVTSLLFINSIILNRPSSNSYRPKMHRKGQVGLNSWLIVDRDLNKVRFQYKETNHDQPNQFWPPYFFLLWMFEAEEMINFYIREMFRKTDKAQSIQDSYFDQNSHNTNTNRSTKRKCKFYYLLPDGKKWHQ